MKAKSDSPLEIEPKQEYDPSLIERKWQRYWEETKIFSPDLDHNKKPFYNLMMFPYPSAEGMHVGNMYAFTGADVYGRFKRMQGFDVFEPIGLDGFGIHSENFALKIGKHPMEQAQISEKNFYRQLHATGNSYDWTRTVETYKPNYYRWTQWLFAQMFKAGLAYRKKAKVNYCPSCKTVLADEQVVAPSSVGKTRHDVHGQDSPDVHKRVCERCGTEVEMRELEQWFFRITEYAQRLLNNIPGLNWTEKVKIAQREWIGRSEGTEIEFKVQSSKFKVEVFTTRPDTLYGATFLVLAPEHPLAQSVNDKQVQNYIKKAKSKSEQDRVTEGKEKTGVFSGLYAINPVNRKVIPIWIADYVSMGYGTGAIMSVPAHDQRDFEFAKKFDLPITQVIRPKDQNYIIIHGCPSKKEKEEEMDLTPNSSTQHWIQWTRRQLEKKDFQVSVPRMPASWEPDYNAWKEEFEKLPVAESTILIGHSCGGAFLVRWLGETKKKIAKLILVAPGKIARDIASPKLKDLYNFEIDSEVKSRVGEITLFISDNEHERLKDSAKIYIEKLQPRLIEIPNRGHFLYEHMGTEEFPELLEVGINLHEAYRGEGVIINSGEWNGLKVPHEIGRVIDWLEKKGIGKREVHYHLRDWLISRQRYWGAPIPMVYCQNCADQGRSWFTTSEAKEESRVQSSKFKVQSSAEWNSAGWYAVPEDQLPVELPYIDDYRPLGTGKSPLANHPEFYNTTCPNCGGSAVRETDVSDTFLDSAWYFFRYLSTERDNIAFDTLRCRKWLPVNMYIGGAEHSVLHLLYSRFVTMVLKDLEYIEFDEPYGRFFAHGLIISEGGKMSKSKGNIVIPDDYIKKYGADTLRLYLMFLGPFSQGGDFRDTGVEGMYRFVKRVWKLLRGSLPHVANDAQRALSKNQAEDPSSLSERRLAKDSNSSENGSESAFSSFTSEQAASSLESLRMMHKTIKRVTEDLEQLHYNTAIAALMEWYNFLSSKLKVKNSKLTLKEVETFLKLLAPFAPHMAEELWKRIRNQELGIRNKEQTEEKNHNSLFIIHDSVHKQAWPKYNEKYLVEDQVTIVVQVNGKKRSELRIKNQELSAKAKIETEAKTRIQKYLEGKEVKNVVYVEGKIINFVVS